MKRNNILVVPKEKLALDVGGMSLDSLIAHTNEHGIWMQRDFAEKDEKFLQIIPYTLVTRQTSSGTEEVFCYQRLQAGGEERLHGRKSVGLGGHVDKNDLGPADTPLWDAVIECSKRELDEELEMPGVYGEYPILFADKLIWDPTDAVGRVHLGVLCICDLGRETTQIRETDKLAGGFLTLDEIDRIPREEFEGWSVEVLDFMNEVKT